MTKNKLDFVWTAYSMYGDVTVQINGVKYLYHIDAAHIEHFLRLYKRSKGKSLAFLKQMAGENYRKL